MSDNKKPKTMAEGWESFRKSVIPADAGTEQVEDMMAAFFAGAIMHAELVTTIGDPGTSEDEAMRILKSIDVELYDYAIVMSRRIALAGATAKATGSRPN